MKVYYIIQNCLQNLHSLNVTLRCLLSYTLYYQATQEKIRKEESFLNGILKTLEAMDFGKIIKTPHDVVNNVTIITPQNVIVITPLTITTTPNVPRGTSQGEN